MKNADLTSRDLAVIWHPCTQMKDHEWLPLTPIRRGDGVYLEDFDGNRYIDAISSWWVNLFGHANPRIGNRIKAQIDTLEHVIFAGFTQEPVIELSERLVNITPDGLDKCFYADNGSSAIEVAIKMSFHYWLNQGKPEKKKFITLGNSYHGETLGALAVGDVELYKHTYGPLLMEVLTAKSPDYYFREAGESEEDCGRRAFDDMKSLLEKNHHEVAAVIVEPLIQCAGYMRMYHPVYLKLLREACDQYGVHLIADEIAVGFGRSGSLFACEQADISPDFMCLSKGLTGGYLPLAVTLTRQSIYDAFYDDYNNMTAFLHSHSYTGNPIACSAALGTLDIFDQNPVIENNRKLSRLILDGVTELGDHPHVGDIRQTGMVTAIEMVADRVNKTPFDWRERRGLKVYQHGLQNGVLLRPLGNVIYFMPPYVINADEINKMTRTAIDGIHLATR